MNQLIPRHPKRKRQPTAECMREQLRLAANEIIRLRADNERLQAPWWRRLVKAA